MMLHPQTGLIRPVLLTSSCFMFYKLHQVCTAFIFSSPDSWNKPQHLIKISTLIPSSHFQNVILILLTPGCNCFKIIVLPFHYFNCNHFTWLILFHFQLFCKVLEVCNLMLIYIILSSYLMFSNSFGSIASLL